MVKKLFKVHLKPSKHLQTIYKSKLDISESSKSKIIAKYKILGKTVVFYQNGLRFIEGVDITEQEQFDSQILRFAHASILINEPVGDKKTCYVDATRNPIEIWIYGQKLEDFIKKYIHLMKTGQVDVDYLINESLKKVEETCNERNVRLYGRAINCSHF